MKVTHFGTGGFPWAHVTNFGGTTITIGSNTNTDPPLSSLNFVQAITVDGAGPLLNPIINVASGSNITLTIDRGPGNSTPSNTVRFHSTGGGSSSLTVEEVDGSPTDSAVTKLIFPNGTLSIASHEATYTPTSSGGGSLVLLEQHTASASAQLDFTSFISSTYDEYLFELIDVRPATNDVQLRIRMGTGGGPTYDTGANYAWALRIDRAGGSALNGAESGQTFIGLNYQSGGTLGINSTAATGGWSGVLRLFDPQSTAKNKKMVGMGRYYDAEPFWLLSMNQGTYLSTTAVTAVRFYMDTGNIADGVIRAYGIAK